MSKKQRITIGICACAMLVVVIGLSIALVLAASQATVINSMSVKFVCYEVQATIDCSAHVVEMSTNEDDGTVVDGETHPTIKTPENAQLKFTAGEGEPTEPAIVEFNEFEYGNCAYRIRYEFVITNTGGTDFTVDCLKGDFADTDNNMSISLRNATDGENDVDGKLPQFTVSPTESKTVYVFVYVTDPAKDGYFGGTEDGALSVSMIGVGSEI